MVAGQASPEALALAAEPGSIHSLPMESATTPSAWLRNTGVAIARFTPLSSRARTVAAVINRKLPFHPVSTVAPLLRQSPNPPSRRRTKRPEWCLRRWENRRTPRAEFCSTNSGFRRSSRFRRHCGNPVPLDEETPPRSVHARIKRPHSAPENSDEFRRTAPCSGKIIPKGSPLDAA